MRKMNMLWTASLIMLAGAGCGPQEGEFESLEAGLSIAYVSGHLGSHQACPLLAQDLRGAPAICMDPCEGDDSGGGFACHNGAMMIRVRNIVDHAVPIRVSKIELIQGDTKTALDIREVATSDGHAINQLEANSEATIRILFPPQESNGPQRTGKVRVTVAGEDGETLEIISPQLDLAPIIAT